MGFVRHLSMRVPWHDRAWDGHVCDAPLKNSSCLALKRISENREDSVEKDVAGKAFNELQESQRPPCLQSNASFLSPVEYPLKRVMTYSKTSPDHKHILPRTIRIPAWGALITPYRWMLKESGFEIARELDLNADADGEPSKPAWLKGDPWIQGFSSQQELLDAFAAPLVEEESLVLFYAPRTPLCDDGHRVLLGAALLQKKHDLVEYPYEKGKSDHLRTMVWERPIQHSLRRKGAAKGFDGGFVMPYHALLKKLERDSGFDPRSYMAFVPDDAREQFSYGSEQVTHGIAAAVLLAARDALERTGEILDGPWDRYISWIDGRLSRLWKLQGPAPGLGVVLSAWHPGFNGTLFAMALSDELEENADPWPVIDGIFSGDRNPPKGSPRITAMLRRGWKHAKQNPSRLDLLKLLSRMEMTKDQADRARSFNGEALSNPYQLFEKDRTEREPISFDTVDRGLYPGEEIAEAHPLPESCNPDLREYDNVHRLRAACVKILEESAASGHALLPIGEVTSMAQKLVAVHKVPLSGQIVDICRDDFDPVVSVIGGEDTMLLQLDRYVESKNLLQAAVDERLQNAPEEVAVSWQALVDKKFGKMRKGDKDESAARKEKTTALERLANSRFAVLIGPAGTGKTTVLQLLLREKKIVGDRLLLLAPTGKARVRLGQETGLGEKSQTIAQFLLQRGRYDGSTGRYFVNPDAGVAEFTTCVVDESSMLTEDMLSAIVDAIPANCRLILVGDPYQLPPIGAGCPFIDIVEYLQNKKDGSGVGELTIPRRQTGEEGGDGASTSVLARADVQLAAVFSGRQLPPGEDEVIMNALGGVDDGTVKYRRWENPADLSNLIDEVLAEELGAAGEERVSVFESSIGATKNEKGYMGFGGGSSREVNRWQILSVNRNGSDGSISLNRSIKEQWRRERLDMVNRSVSAPRYMDWMRFAGPRGPEQIVYGDKVICTRNHWRSPWLYSRSVGENEFLANGEIGIVTGQMSLGRKEPRFTNVEFSDRSDRRFSFRESDFSEDHQPYLELAYALTVHKAQGSEFDSVILVLPLHSQLVSREMLYTALTRQKRRIWILHQGSFDRFLEFRKYEASDTSRRITNLFHAGANKDRLIHRTLGGEMVSSKSELIIANILHNLQGAGLVKYEVEPRLPFDDGNGRWADFKIEAGGKSWYWEHCGMLDDKHYRARWNKKLELYASNGFTVHSDENAAGRLIVTEDGPGRGLDSMEIDALARKLFSS